MIEERAINGSLDAITNETTRDVVNDVVFIIERYMYYINSLMDAKKMESLKKFETQIDFE